MIDPRLLHVVGDFLLPHLQNDRPALIGIAGSQGSGKSTLAAYLASAYGGVSLSLDDVYLTKAERQNLASTLHPLFATRGPPLTHDLGLLDRVLAALHQALPDSRTALPAFDKLADDRRPQSEWPVYVGRPRLIVLEGWCLGAKPEPEAQLLVPVNAMEANLDPDAVWRRAVNGALAADYARLRARLEGLVYLRAPSFERVLDWRCQQEAGLLGIDAVDADRRRAIGDFIARFERLTRWIMRGGIVADLEIRLDDDRRFIVWPQEDPMSEG
ncbi:kinase [Brevundimonas sp.]|uniref:kinase n=1 Tax=Brevundimonas sp. TaxID=1871086 RepID=UPI002FC8B5EB